MKINKIIIIGLIFLNSSIFFAQTEPPEYIIQLAEKENLEVVFGNSFPYINPYGCSGSPVIKGLLFDEEESLNKYISSPFIVFLTRKKINDYDYSKKAISIIANYKYYLFFVKYQENSYQISEIHESLLGGLNYTWDSNIDIKLSEFRYLSSPNKKGPSEISTTDLINKPVIMSCDNSIQYFIYYKGKWLTHIKKGW